MVESSIKNEAFAKNEKEEIEAFFFIATANVSQTIISKVKLHNRKVLIVHYKKLVKESKFIKINCCRK